MGRLTVCVTHSPVHSSIGKPQPGVERARWLFTIIASQHPKPPATSEGG